MYGYVYRIVNKINNKSYIGITSRTVEIRFNEHLEQSKKLLIDDHSILHKAINKYGEDAFLVETIDSADSREELSYKEQFWVDKLQTMCPLGYNVAAPGYGGNLGEDVNRRISESLKGVNTWSSGRILYNNGVDEIRLLPQVIPPEGYIKGALPKTQEEIDKRKDTMSKKSEQEKQLIIQKQKDSLLKTLQNRTREEQEQINKRISESHLGIEPWNKGVPDWWTEEHRENLINAVSKPKTDEHKANLSKSCLESRCHAGDKNGMYGKHPIAHNKGKIYIKKDNIIKYVTPEELQKYLDQGFVTSKNKKHVKT